MGDPRSEARVLGWRARAWQANRVKQYERRRRDVPGRQLVVRKKLAGDSRCAPFKTWDETQPGMKGGRGAQEGRGSRTRLRTAQRGRMSERRQGSLRRMGRRDGSISLRSARFFVSSLFLLPVCLPVGRFVIGMRRGGQAKEEGRKEGELGKRRRREEAHRLSIVASASLLRMVRASAFRPLSPVASPGVERTGVEVERGVQGEGGQMWGEVRGPRTFLEDEDDTVLDVGFSLLTCEPSKLRRKGWR